MPEVTVQNKLGSHVYLRGVTDSQRILDAVRRLVRLLRLSDRASQAKTGLSAAQLFVLSELGSAKSLSLTELAERTRTDQSSVSVVVTRLAGAGLVARNRAEDDGRRLVLSLTRSGRAALQHAPRIAQHELVRAVEELPAAERRRFADTFAAIVERMGGGTAAPPMFFEDDSRPGKRKRSG